MSRARTHHQFQGATAKHGVDLRVTDDYYPTPHWGTLALLDHADLPLSASERVWEPACGDGAMATVIQERYKTVATDVRPRKGYGTPADFLTCRVPPRVAAIVTNPPFYLGKEFALRALDLPVRYVALLLRFTVLAGNTAWVNLLRAHRPTEILTLQHRLPYLHDGVWKLGLFPHAWVIWDKRFSPKSQTTFTWSTARGKSPTSPV